MKTMVAQNAVVSTAAATVAATISTATHASRTGYRRAGHVRYRTTPPEALAASSPSISAPAASLRGGLEITNRTLLALTAFAKPGRKPTLGRYFGGSHRPVRGHHLRRLLPLVDELDRATAHRASDLESHPWAEGVVLIGRRLADLLRDLGVERIGVEGEAFDPHIHEAVFYDRHPDVSGQIVARVIKAGYRQGDRLLRPASVTVVGPIG